MLKVGRFRREKRRKIIVFNIINSLTVLKIETHACVCESPQHRNVDINNQGRASSFGCLLMSILIPQKAEHPPVDVL